jgi:hypothetical protein
MEWGFLMMKRILAAALVPAMLAGCGQHAQNSGNDRPSWKNLWQQNANVITVKTLNGDAVANAQVLIGDTVNSPFAGNYLTTNASGQVEIPAGWTDALPVTVQATGYVRVTYMAQTPGALTFQLRPTPTMTQFEVKGAAQGLPVKDGDGLIDFGLVLPAFTKTDLLRFSIDSVISPQTDRITALGQNIDVPANISLPRQSERYSLFNITLDKPTYRIYFNRTGISRVFAARGRFPFKSVVDSLRGGSQFYELINSFKISGGAIRDLDVKSGTNALDIPTGELNFTDSKTVMAPTFPGDEMFIAVGVSNQSGYLIPTDVKNLAAGQKMTLATLPNSDQLYLAVLKKTAEMKSGGDRMSAAFLPFSQQAPKMLPMIADPTMSSSGELLMPKFNTVDGVNALATYAVLSRQDQVQQGSGKATVATPMWEVYANQWITQLKMPQWPTQDVEQGQSKKRWEVNFIGSQTASQAAIGPAMINAATHVTHSSITF